MTARRPRLARLGLAACAIAASVSLLVDRADRDWPAPPAIPYADPVDQHWLYVALRQLSAPGDALGVWGWAAHTWVYSGLVPATRESSTEFAWLDWGDDHYYRRRYLDALARTPPPFFIEAAGPHQFLFNDRATHGVASLPGLQPFLDRGYRRLLDDGNIGLYARHDVADACCTAGPSGGWRDSAGLVRMPKHVDNLPEFNGVGWSITDAVDAGGRARLSLVVSSPRAFDRVLVPMVLGPHGRRAGFRLRAAAPGGGSPRGTECDAVIDQAPAMAGAVCILSLAPTRKAVLVFSDTQADQGAWVALGQPLLMHAADPAS